jgi:hypothetical protein
VFSFLRSLASFSVSDIESTIISEFLEKSYNKLKLPRSGRLSRVRSHSTAFPDVPRIDCGFREDPYDILLETFVFSEYEVPVESEVELNISELIEDGWWEGSNCGWLVWIGNLGLVDIVKKFEYIPRDDGGLERFRYFLDHPCRNQCVTVRVIEPIPLCLQECF